MVTLMTLPSFKGTRNQVIKALFICLMIDAVIIVTSINF